MAEKHPDVHGKALYDYYKGKTGGELMIKTSYDEVEEMPPEVFFRDFDDFPEIEVHALQLCKGKVLDVGAGTGDHSLLLQEWGKETIPLEISPNCVKLMHERNIEHVEQGDIFSYSKGKFDSILLLMNGVGLAGDTDGFIKLLSKFDELLLPDGQVIFDSSDISYLYEDGLPKPKDRYFGEVSYQYYYTTPTESIEGEWFDWLYLDKVMLLKLATDAGWKADFVFENDQDHFLVKLEKG
ncbi:methyltransferase domain-containing protein [Flammeovirgaceae bacterium SG7u.111]|nr:methyltransferase domain-containing protein [Flammeovirgaceae bacterium SG7u.132]WPO37457.1 methyltransferase domain-containing protein [Flammeovirgaceae bacterium SG7u.111]